MFNLNILQKEVLGSVLEKAVIYDSEGSLSISGIKLRGIDGSRTLKLFLEGINRDIKEFTPAGAAEIYRNICKDPELLKNALGAPMKLSRIVDADIITGR
jgi:hypothetical protein